MEHSKIPKTSTILRLLLIFIALFSLSSCVNSCNLGCLRCNQSTNHCLICDFKSFYYDDPEMQICVRNILPNCLLAIVPGTCLLCSEGYFPDRSGVCLAVTSSNSISKCKAYFSEKKCAKCKKEYYLSDNSSSCMSSKQSYDSNCEIYGESECLVCSEGFYFRRSTGVCEGRQLTIYNFKYLKFLVFKWSLISL